MVCRNANNLAELYAERCPLYEKYADVVVSLDGKSVEQAAAEIVAAAKNTLNA